MPRDDPHTPLGMYTCAVEGMVDGGVPFDEVEREIDATELAPDEKAALWLLAWSLEAPHVERARARTTLELVSTLE